jgi:hypothetical protein
MKVSSVLSIAGLVQLFVALLLLTLTTAPLLPSGLLLGVGTILLGLGIILTIEGE